MLSLYGIYINCKRHRMKRTNRFLDLPRPSSEIKETNRTTSTTILPSITHNDLYSKINKKTQKKYK